VLPLQHRPVRRRRAAESRGGRRAGSRISESKYSQHFSARGQTAARLLTTCGNLIANSRGRTLAGNSASQSTARLFSEVALAGARSAAWTARPVDARALTDIGASAREVIPVDNSWLAVRMMGQIPTAPNFERREVDVRRQALRPLGPSVIAAQVSGFLTHSCCSGNRNPR